MSEEISKSKQKREQRKAEAQAAKKAKNFDSIITWVVGILIAAVVIGVIVAGIISSVKSQGSAVEASADFSEGLTEEGYVKGADLSKVDIDALDAIVVQYADVAYTQEDCDSQIQQFLENTAYYSDDAALTVEDGSEINLDYVGYVDGVAFDGGNTNGAGTTLTIGSGTYIDNFEEQLIGAHPGDAVTVEVTFPDPYDNNADLAGKAATFECVVNSIKTVPEYTDEWVAENCSAYASTKAELEAYVIEQGYNYNLINYLSNYVLENVSSKGAPKSYLKHLKAVRKYTDNATYEYYNSYFSSMLGYSLYGSFEDYTGKTEAEYAEYLDTIATQNASADVTLEAYFKAKGLTVSDETYQAVLDTYGTEAVSTYGEPFLKQEAIKEVALQELANTVTVEGK